MIEDKPIKDDSQDKLKRDYFSEKLSDTIKNYLNIKYHSKSNSTCPLGHSQESRTQPTKFDIATDHSDNKKGSFVIGLNGKWGSGKTSIINLIKTKLDDENNDLTIIEFDPWIYSSQEHLVSIFLEKFSDKLSAFENFKNLIRKYNKTLNYKVYGEVDLEVAKIGGSVQTDDKHLSEHALMANEIESIEKIKSDINTKMSDIKVLCIMDDIDRLNDVEIADIFKLVKEVVDFDNIVYLLSFDKEIVISALNKIQQGNGQQYLNKIVNVPFDVPITTKQELKKVFLKYFIDEIEEEIVSTFFKEFKKEFSSKFEHDAKKDILKIYDNLFDTDFLVEQKFNYIKDEILENFSNDFEDNFNKELENIFKEDFINTFKEEYGKKPKINISEFINNFCFDFGESLKNIVIGELKKEIHNTVKSKLENIIFDDNFIDQELLKKVKNLINKNDSKEIVKPEIKLESSDNLHNNLKTLYNKYIQNKIKYDIKLYCDNTKLPIKKLDDDEVKDLIKEFEKDIDHENSINYIVEKLQYKILFEPYEETQDSPYDYLKDDSIYDFIKRSNNEFKEKFGKEINLGVKNLSKEVEEYFKSKYRFKLNKILDNADITFKLSNGDYIEQTLQNIFLVYFVDKFVDDIEEEFRNKLGETFSKKYKKEFNRKIDEVIENQLKEYRIKNERSCIQKTLTKSYKKHYENNKEKKEALEQFQTDFKEKIETIDESDKDKLITKKLNKSKELIDGFVKEFEDNFKVKISDEFKEKANKKFQTEPRKDFMEYFFDKFIETITTQNSIKNVDCSGCEKALKNLIDDVTPNYDVQQLNYILSPFEEFGGKLKDEKNGIIYLFDNVRDVKRYLNILKFNYNVLGSKNNFKDFLIIMALQLFRPEVYDKIKNDERLFTEIYEQKDICGEKDLEYEDFKTIKGIVDKDQNVEFLLREAFRKIDIMYRINELDKENKVKMDPELKYNRYNQKFNNNLEYFDRYYSISSKKHFKNYFKLLVDKNS